jgi:hypothetical protein
MAVITGTLPAFRVLAMQFSRHLARHIVINIVPHFAVKSM